MKNKLFFLACSLLLVRVTAHGEETAPAVLTLDQARELARKSSPSILSAREKLLQSELLIDKAWSAFQPQWTATGTYTHYNAGMKLRMPDFTSIATSPEACGPLWNPNIGFCFTRYEDVTIQRQDSFNFFTQLSQPLFVPRAITGLRSAYRAYDLARVNQENNEDVLLYNVETAYFAALTARRFVDIARSAVELRRDTLAVARARVEVGQSPKITALSAEISLNQAEQDLRSAENSYQLAKEALRLLCGLERDFEIAEPPLRQHPEKNLQELLQEAYARRRDLQLARLNLELAEISRTDAWFRFLPSLVATGSLRVADVKGFTNEYVTWNIGLALSLPLYDGGLRYAYLKESASRIRQANHDLEQARRAIESELRQLWLRMEMAEANLKKAAQAVELAREQVRLVRASFEAGAATHLEVQEANSALFFAEINQAQQQLGLQLALLKLEKATVMFNPMGGYAAVPSAEGSTGGAPPSTASPSASSAEGTGSSPSGPPAGMEGF